MDNPDDDFLSDADLRAIALRATIAAQQARIEALTGALEPFAKIADGWESCPDTGTVRTFPLALYRRARSAISEGERS
jgi:hypothetical protein